MLLEAKVVPSLGSNRERSTEQCSFVVACHEKAIDSHKISHHNCSKLILHLAHTQWVRPEVTFVTTIGIFSVIFPFPIFEADQGIFFTLMYASAVKFEMALLLITFISSCGSIMDGFATCNMENMQNSTCTKGSPYMKSFAPSADACCTICQREAECVQWTFHDDKNSSYKSCYRTNITARKRGKLTGAICGEKKSTQSPQQPVPPAPSINLNFSWDVLPTWVKITVSSTNASHTAFVAKNFPLVQVTTHHGNHTEADNIAVCRQVKEASPSTACLFYWNTEKINNSTVTARYMINSRPDWFLRDDRGRYAKALRNHLCPDYRQPAAGDFYLSACLNATHSGVVDGCTLDSGQNFNEPDTDMLTKKYVFTKKEQDQYVSGKRGALQRLQQTAGGKAMFVHCGLCLTKGHTCAGMSAQMSQHFDVTGAWVDSLRLLASEGKGLLLYDDGARKKRLDCSDDTQRGMLIGAFLVAAGNNSYFNCGPNCNNSHIYPEFEKPLGAPLEQARSVHGTLTRRFARGAVAKFRPGKDATTRGQACVIWGDGTVSGECPDE